MSDVDVKIKIEVLDSAAKKALGDISTQADKMGTTTDKASKRAASGLKVVGSESKAALGEFAKGTQAVTSGMGSFGGSISSVSSLLSGPLAIGLGVASAAALGLKAGLDLIKEAEQIKTISAQFDALAANAGVASGALREAFVGAVDGLVDDDEAIRSANKAMQELGEFAESLPQVMAIARKATSVFGGEVTDNFDKVAQAIASGNTRTLKQLGIFVNSEAAIKKYADTLGVTARDLTETEKRQALLNAVLEKGGAAFATVDESNLKTTNNLKRLGVAFGEAKETGAAFFDRLFGGATSAAIASGTGALTEFTRLFKIAFGTEQEAAQARIQGTEKQVSELQKRLEEQGRFLESNKAWLTQSGQLAQVQAQYDALRRQVGGLSEDQEASDMRAMKRSQVIGAIDQGRVATTRALTEAQKAQIEQEKKARESQAEALVKEAESAQAKYTRDLELLQAQKDAELITEEDFFTRKQELAVSKFIEEQAAIDDLRKNGAFKSEQDYFAARDNLATTFAANQAKRDADEINAKKKLEKEKTEEEKRRSKEREQNLSSSLSFISTLQQSSVKEFFFVGKAAALATAYIDGQAAVMKALASAPPPFNFALAAAVGVAAAVNIGRIAGAKPPAFEDGGIVPGSSYSGDRVMARVNSGEMVLNKGQQANLFRMANGGGGSGELAARVEQLASAVMSLASQPVTVAVDGKEIFRATREQLAAGRSF